MLCFAAFFSRSGAGVEKQEKRKRRSKASPHPKRGHPDTASLGEARHSVAVFHRQNRHTVAGHIPNRVNPIGILAERRTRPMSEDTDRLLARLRGGDADAIGAVRAHRPRLWRMLHVRMDARLVAASRRGHLAGRIPRRRPPRRGIPGRPAGAVLRLGALPDSPAHAGGAADAPRGEDARRGDGGRDRG